MLSFSYYQNFKQTQITTGNFSKQYITNSRQNIFFFCARRFFGKKCHPNRSFYPVSIIHLSLFGYIYIPFHEDLSSIKSSVYHTVPPPILFCIYFQNKLYKIDCITYIYLSEGFQTPSVSIPFLYDRFTIVFQKRNTNSIRSVVYKYMTVFIFTVQQNCKPK